MPTQRGDTDTGLRAQRRRLLHEQLARERRYHHGYLAEGKAHSARRQLGKIARAEAALAALDDAMTEGRIADPAWLAP